MSPAGIAKAMGSDCTSSAIENRFRKIKVEAKWIEDALEKGIDPLSLNLGVGKCQTISYSFCHFLLWIDKVSEVVRYYGQDLNKKGLQNALFRHFNPIVKQLQVEADGTGTHFLEYDLIWYSSQILRHTLGKSKTERALRMRTTVMSSQ